MIQIELSIDEIIATLNHSSLPTALIEGDDDVVVYRVLEALRADTQLSVFPAGGRDKVLEVFLRRTELRHPERVVFVADRDLWVLSEAPEEYRSDRLVLTDGYSVENDVIRDGRLLDLLTDAERGRFMAELSLVNRWYALAVSRHMSDSAEPYKQHANHVLGTSKPYEEWIRLVENESYPDELLSRISSDALRMLRGKTLMGLLMRHLSYKGRLVHHQHLSLMESTSRLNRGPLLDRLFTEITAKL